MTINIKLLLTGGTIDKSYNESNGELHFIETSIPELLALGRNKTHVLVEKVVFKDSLDMIDGDRQDILTACKASSENHILITHGTDTMVDTAKVLANVPELQAKKIVLVGAMVPYVFKHSDAMFNIGFALGALQCVSQGVYIAMNGIIFPWDEVIKNKSLGIFEHV